MNSITVDSNYYLLLFSGVAIALVFVHTVLMMTKGNDVILGLLIDWKMNKHNNTFQNYPIYCL